ncbi:hypothetical protein H0H87_001770 [Tephrocybe sp. NHM501043]|nr:hypothetical protein H0H87_001770 [Tephrocybe sp. NHM501043]
MEEHNMESEKLSTVTRRDHSGFKTLLQKTTEFLLHWGVETHGIAPTTEEQRCDKRLYQMFFVWFSGNLNILAFSTGSAGPTFFNLGLRHCVVILLVADVVSCAVPAFFAVFGPKLGTRGMVQARFSWGYDLPSDSHMELLTLMLPLNRQNILRFESIAWIPNVIAFIVMLGVSGKHLKASNYPPYPPPTATAIVSFVTFIASSVISWCTMTPDYGVYHDAKASR